jgi:hypothetical protein
VWAGLIRQVKVFANHSQVSTAWQHALADQRFGAKLGTIVSAQGCDGGAPTLDPVKAVGLGALKIAHDHHICSKLRQKHSASVHFVEVLIIMSCDERHKQGRNIVII